MKLLAKVFQIQLSAGNAGKYWNREIEDKKETKGEIEMDINLELSSYDHDCTISSQYYWLNLSILPDLALIGSIAA